MEREKVQKYYSITFNQRETSDDGSVHIVLTPLYFTKEKERVKSFLHKVP